jgi:hypothetical protein
MQDNFGPVDGPDQPVFHDQEPLHGLVCRKAACAGRLRRRHNAIVQKLADGLAAAEGVQVAIEQRIPGSDKVADIVVTKNGEQTSVDVTIACPATLVMVSKHDSHRVQGVAAERSYRRKLQKYCPVFRGRALRPDDDSVPGFLPFVVETGGFIHPRSVAWLDRLLEHDATALKGCYSKVLGELQRQQGLMLAKHWQTLAPL